MINRVTMIGRLTRDPEVRHTPNGSSVTSFAIATNKAWKGKDDNWNEKVTFSEWQIWNGVGENFAKNARKGDLVYLEGEYGVNEWTDNEDVKRSSPRFTAFTSRVLSRAGAGKPTGEASEAEEKSEPKAPARRGRPPKKAEAPKPVAEDNDDSEDDQDIPF